MVDALDAEAIRRGAACFADGVEGPFPPILVSPAGLKEARRAFPAVELLSYCAGTVALSGRCKAVSHS